MGTSNMTKKFHNIRWFYFIIIIIIIILQKKKGQVKRLNMFLDEIMTKSDLYIDIQKRENAKKLILEKVMKCFLAKCWVRYVEGVNAYWSQVFCSIQYTY